MCCNSSAHDAHTLCRVPGWWCQTPDLLPGSCVPHFQHSDAWGSSLVGSSLFLSIRPIQTSDLVRVAVGVRFRVRFAVEVEVAGLVSGWCWG